MGAASGKKVHEMKTLNIKPGDLVRSRVTGLVDTVAIVDRDVFALIHLTGAYNVADWDKLVPVEYAEQNENAATSVTAPSQPQTENKETTNEAEDSTVESDGQQSVCSWCGVPLQWPAIFCSPECCQKIREALG